MVEQTVGAPHRWVTPRLSMASQIASARTARRQMCVPPMAVTIQVNLVAGGNTIRATGSTADSGPNLDYLDLSR